MAKIFGVHEKAPNSDWNTNLTFLAAAGAWGTTTGNYSSSRRVGDSLESRFYFVSGTLAGGNATIGMPTGVLIDSTSTKLSSTPSVQRVGYAEQIKPSAGAGTIATFDIFYDGSDTSNLYLAVNNASGQLTKIAASSLINNGYGINAYFTVPIAGWAANDILRPSDNTKI